MGISLIDKIAWMVEMEDTGDLKSPGRKAMPVQSRLQVFGRCSLISVGLY